MPPLPEWQTGETFQKQRCFGNWGEFDRQAFYLVCKELNICMCHFLQCATDDVRTLWLNVMNALMYFKINCYVIILNNALMLTDWDFFRSIYVCVNAN
jgi:hypothetical protein